MSKPTHDGSIGDVVVDDEGTSWLWVGGEVRWILAEEIQPDAEPPPPFLRADD